jgi:limonene 1,2-monooxygenase
MAHRGLTFGIFLAPFHRLGRPPGRSDDPLSDGVRMGATLVGSPETVIEGINRPLEYSQGGFGGILFRAHE